MELNHNSNSEFDLIEEVYIRNKHNIQPDIFIMNNIVIVELSDNLNLDFNLIVKKLIFICRIECNTNDRTWRSK